MTEGDTAHTENNEHEGEVFNVDTMHYQRVPSADERVLQKVTGPYEQVSSTGEPINEESLTVPVATGDDGFDKGGKHEEQITSAKEVSHGDVEVSAVLPEIAAASSNIKSKRHVDARLHWESISLYVETGGKKGGKTCILDGVWGESPQGEISAIMGPSGSGKTSLLSILSGRMSNTTAHCTVEADSVTWNGRPIRVTDISTRQKIAFVAQDDSLPVSATPREAILFSARLRLDKEKSLEELQDITNTMLQQLHLGNCADTFVGGALLKGISGGERKRTSVAVELVTRPRLIFLDEPTSGLDSFNALEMLQVLKQVAETGSSVMLTIHQPSSEIWNLFDRLLLLKEGRVMYEGRRELVAEKFQNCGYPLPPNYNPADWIMFVAQSEKTEVLESKGFFPVNDFSVHGSNTRNGNGNTSFSNRLLMKKSGSSLDENSAVVEKSGSSSVLGSADDVPDRVGFGVQTKWQFRRELQHFKRNVHPLRTRVAMTLVISTLAGCIYYQVGKSDYKSYLDVQVTFGALLLAVIANMFATVMPALVAFPEERPVFLREYSSGCYTVVSYFVSKFALEAITCAVQVTVSTLITYYMVGLQQNYGNFWAAIYAMALTATALGAMVGSAVKDPHMAIEFLPAVFMPQILFSGFFIPKEVMPDWLAWLTYIFPMTYVMRLVLVGEFENGCDGNTVNFCEIMLDNVEAHREDVWWYWLVLTAQFIFCRLVALIVLRRKAEQFY